MEDMGGSTLRKKSTKLYKVVVDFEVIEPIPLGIYTILLAIYKSVISAQAVYFLTPVRHRSLPNRIFRLP
jgi:hypothetical protein